MKYDYENENVTQEYKVEESAPKYYSKQQGEYTLEDYYALPDDVRMGLSIYDKQIVLDLTELEEIIDG